MVKEEKDAKLKSRRILACVAGVEREGEGEGGIWARESVYHPPSSLACDLAP